MIKKIGTLLITILGAALLVYSATRSLDFIGRTLPPDRQILAWFGLAALDGGVLIWLICYLYGARGWQRAIAILMLIVDTVGCVAMFTLDTLLNTGTSGMTAQLTPEEVQMAVLALSGIIALNICATLAFHVADPDMLKAAAEEEARDQIDDEELKQIKANAQTLAAEVAPIRAKAWQLRARSEYLSLLGDSTDTIDAEYHDAPAVLANPPKTTKKPAGLLSWIPNHKNDKPTQPTVDNTALLSTIATLRAELATLRPPTYTPVGPADLRTYAAETTTPPTVQTPANPKNG